MHEPGVGGFQRTLPEIQLPVGQFHREFTVTLLVLFGQVGAARHESVVGFVQQDFLRALQRIVLLLFLINGLHPCEEFRMLIDLVLVLHQQRLHLLGGRLHRVIAVTFENVEEEVCDGAEPFARTVKRDHRVPEIRRGWVAYNLFDIPLRLGNRLLKRR